MYKLHLKHYHMSPASFRHRTSELHLSPKIYELYEQVVKECEHCQTSIVRPERSRVSGLRANVFGDLIFVDHTDVTINEWIYVAFVIIDATTYYVGLCTELQDR